MQTAPMYIIFLHLQSWERGEEGQASEESWVIVGGILTLYTTTNIYNISIDHNFRS